MYSSCFHLFINWLFSLIKLNCPFHEYPPLSSFIMLVTLMHVHSLVVPHVFMHQLATKLSNIWGNTPNDCLKKLGPSMLCMNF